MRNKTDLTIARKSVSGCYGSLRHDETAGGGRSCWLGVQGLGRGDEILAREEDLWRPNRQPSGNESLQFVNFSVCARRFVDKDDIYQLNQVEVRSNISKN